MAHTCLRASSHDAKLTLFATETKVRLSVTRRNFLGNVNSMGTQTSQNADGYFFVCVLCGNTHEVPEQMAPYRNGHTLCNILFDEVALGCAEKPGTALYSFSDFTAYQLTS